MDEKLIFEGGTMIAESDCRVGSFKDFNLGAGMAAGLEGGEEGLASSTAVDKVALYTIG